MRRAQLEPPLRVGEVFNHVRNGVELSYAVTGFYSCLFVRIGDDLGFERFTVPDLFVARHSRLFGTARGISLRTTERISLPIHHLSRDAGVLDFRIPIGKATPLLFL